MVLVSHDVFPFMLEYFVGNLRNWGLMYSRDTEMMVDFFCGVEYSDTVICTYNYGKGSV